MEKHSLDIIVFFFFLSIFLFLVFRFIIHLFFSGLNTFFPAFFHCTTRKRITQETSTTIAEKGKLIKKKKEKTK